LLGCERRSVNAFFNVKTHSSISLCLKIKGWYPGIFFCYLNIYFHTLPTYIPVSHNKRHNNFNIIKDNAKITIFSISYIEAMAMKYQLVMQCIFKHCFITPLVYPGRYKSSGNLIFQHSWIVMSSTLIHLFVNYVINSYKLSHLLLRLWTFKLRYTGLFRIWSIFKNDSASWNVYII